MLGNEPILFEASVQKISRFNTAREQYFILTGKNFYLFDGASMVRRHAIKRLLAIVKSASGSEIVLINPSSKDMRLKGLDETQRALL